MTTVFMPWRCEQLSGRVQAKSSMIRQRHVPQLTCEAKDKGKPDGGGRGTGDTGSSWANLQQDQGKPRGGGAAVVSFKSWGLASSESGTWVLACKVWETQERKGVLCRPRGGVGQGEDKKVERKGGRTKYHEILFQLQEIWQPSKVKVITQA